MRSHRVYSYLIALGAVGLAAGLRTTVLAYGMGDLAPFGVFIMAIILSAWIGGLAPGLFATALSVAAGSYLFIGPHGLTPQQIAILLTLCINGCLISLMCESLRLSRSKAEAAREEAAASHSQLQASEQRFHKLADSAPVMIRMSDLTGECTWFNQRWLKFTGRTMEQEIGAGWLENVHDHDRDRCRQIYQDHFRRRVPFEIDYRLRRQDGAYRWIMDRGFPLFSDKQVFLGYIGGCVDVHERTEQEASNEAMFKIEQMARREAERVALLKDEFLATISHEMRTPLTAMLGWVQLLRTRSLADDMVPKALETIERNARAQAKLIDDLLDMSHILSGRVRIDMEPINPSGAIEAAIAAAEPAAAAKKIRLVSVLDSNTVSISGDATRLQQIIWNLLSNAVKFTPSGGTIIVSANLVDSHLEISVKDSGEGIRPEFLPHVFDRFRQQNASTMRKHQGLGLGLSIVKQLVELHGGTVSAKSAGLGQGSTFTISLPASKGSSSGEKNAALPAVSNPDETLPSLIGTRVLVVDDDSDARELLRSIFAQSGASVRTAASAAEALEQFASRCPDVLVSDLGMPEQDGYQLIRSIRAMDGDAGGRIPALALTAFTRSEDRRRAIDAGFHMHLSKPVEPAELVTVVASLIRR